MSDLFVVAFCGVSALVCGGSVWVMAKFLEKLSRLNAEVLEAMDREMGQ
jgi:hypothetical protein